MKKVMLAFTAITLLFTACKKEDDPAAEKWYLTRLIDVYGERKDTTFVSWHTDNRLKEFNYTYIYNGAAAFNAFLPVYENGKITGIQMRTQNRPEAHTIASFTYTGNLVSSIVHQNYDQDQAQWVNNSHDSLVYAGGKLAELYVKYRNGSTTWYKLTWEGENVKRCAISSKQQDTEFLLYQTIKYTYDSKPAFHQVVNDNYQWLADVSNFKYLSANNLLKAEMIREPEGTLDMTTTHTFTYDGDILKSVDTKEEMVFPEVYVQDYKTIMEYTKR